MVVVALKLSFVILSCAVFVTQGDVSHLGYNRHRGQRLRLQRLEAAPTPYPAAGYRPNREFSLPSGQPLFPLANQHNNRPQISSGFDHLSEPQRPQTFYGSPDPEPRFRPQNSPQNPNGFSNSAEPQQHEVEYQFENGNEQSQNVNIGFHNQQPQNFGEPNQQPEVQSETSNNVFNNGFDNLAEPQQAHQRPELLYGAPNSQEQEVQSARLRQHLIARLQQAQRLEQLQQQAESKRYRQAQSKLQSQQQFFNSPQTLYSAPSRQQQQPIPAQSEYRSSRLIAQKPARLTDNREESELEADANTSDAVEDIETTTKSEGKASVNPVAANTGLVNYYPANAFSFVQPLNAGYVASPNYQMVQPISAAYTVRAPFMPQQYTLAAAAPAQLRAW